MNEDEMKKDKRKPSMFHFCISVILCEGRRQALHGTVEYQGANRVTKGKILHNLDNMKCFISLGNPSSYQNRPENWLPSNTFKLKRLRKKTDYNTKYGQVEYLVMPGGLVDDLATSKSLINRILIGYAGFLCWYR